MADTQALLEEGFFEELARLSEAYDLYDVFGDVAEERALAYGRAGARAALAPLVWRAAAGEVIDTSSLRELLDVSRQALGQRVERGTLLGLPGERTTLYPVWQFDGTEVRPVVADILAAFRGEVGDDVDPRMIASWAQTPQRELDAETPAAWIVSGRDSDVVVLAAKRAAQALAR